MTNKKEYLIDLIFNKLKYKITKKINIEKSELNKFVNFLISNN